MIRSAVIGFGMAGGWHAGVLNSNGDAELVAICDALPENLEDAKEQFDVATYDDAAELLSSESLDSVHVCTPPDTHVDIAEPFLREGIPVLIEKPLATSTDEVRRLIRLNEETGTTASVIHNKLFAPPVQRALSVAESGDIGEVTGATMLFGEHRDLSETERGDWVFDLPGGEIGEGIAHQAYLPLAFTGRLGGVRCVSHQNFSGYEDIRFDGVAVEATDTSERQLVNIQVTTHSNNQELLLVYGTDGMIRLDLRNGTAVVLPRGSDGPDPDESVSETTIFIRQLATERVKTALRNRLIPVLRRLNGGVNPTSGHHVQIDRHLDALQADDTPPVSLEDGLDTIRVIEALE